MIFHISSCWPAKCPDSWYICIWYGFAQLECVEYSSLSFIFTAIKLRLHSKRAYANLRTKISLPKITQDFRHLWPPTMTASAVASSIMKCHKNFIRFGCCCCRPKVSASSVEIVLCVLTTQISTWDELPKSSKYLKFCHLARPQGGHTHTVKTKREEKFLQTI